MIPQKVELKNMSKNFVEFQVLLVQLMAQLTLIQMSAATAYPAYYVFKCNLSFSCIPQKYVLHPCLWGWPSSVQFQRFIDYGPILFPFQPESFS